MPIWQKIACVSNIDLITAFQFFFFRRCIFRIIFKWICQLREKLSKIFIISKLFRFLVKMLHKNKPKKKMNERKERSRRKKKLLSFAICVRWNSYLSLCWCFSVFLLLLRRWTYEFLFVQVQLFTYYLYIERR